MNLLLDTHTLLWWHEQSSNLSRAAFDALADPSTTVFFSVVSLWESQIKQSLGKLKLHDPLPEIVDQQHQVNGFGLLAVHAEHIYQLGKLGPHHKDPFDRLLVAQAQHEGLMLVTQDKKIVQYSVPVLW